MFRLLLQPLPDSAAAAVRPDAPAAAAAAAAAAAVYQASDEHASLAQRTLSAELHLFRRDGSRSQQAEHAAQAASAAAAATAAGDSAGATAAPAAPHSSAAAAVHPISPLSSSARDMPALNCRQLLVVAIPHLLRSTHLLQHIAGLPLTSVQSCVRVICPRTGQHSLLFDFRSVADARAFYEAVHNHPFAARRREVAYVMHISELEERPLGSATAAPSSAAAASVSPLDGFAELPACPRCLSKLDSSVTDIVSELEECSWLRVKKTSAHADGGWRRMRIPIWPEVRCEVCQLGAKAAAHSSASTAAATLSCAECTANPCATASTTFSSLHATDHSLWMCLLCAHLGCGRYASGGGQHAFAHGSASGHTYAMEVTLGAIWDYSSDGYIHRVHGHAASAAATAAAAAAAAASAASMRARLRRPSAHEDEGDEHKSSSDDESDDADAPASIAALAWNGWNEVPSRNSSVSPTGFPVRSLSDGFSVSSTNPPSSAPSAMSLLAVAARADGEPDPSASAGGLPSYGLDLEEESALLHSKLESIASFYNQLLTDTLRRQYEHFAAKAASMHEEDEKQRSELEPSLAAQAAALRAESVTLTSELAAADARAKVLASNVRELSGRSAKINEENTFLRTLNQNLLQDQMAHKKREKEAAAAAAAASSDSNAAAGGSSTAAASSSSSPPPLAAAASGSASASSASSPPSAVGCVNGASLALSSLEPALVSRYARMREEKAKRIAVLEKELKRNMEEMEQRTAKEQALAKQQEQARKERVQRSLAGSSASAAAASRGRRG
jgi:hypothetical protein